MRLSDFQTAVGDREIVSFDIFDTLIERDCLLPSDVFIRTGERILGANSAKSFCMARMAAERKARHESQTGEVTLAEIYAILAAKLGVDAAQSAAVEEEEELKSVRPKVSVIPLFEWAKANRRVVLTTDMYLSSDILRRMLAKCGIEGYEVIFLSCECGADKVSGRLFEIVAERLDVSNFDIAHVGDTISADVRGASSAGVLPIFIPRRAMLRRLVLQKLRSVWWKLTKCK